MKKEVKNWLDSATYDLESAEHMFNAGRYVYTIFLCQLALEKILKAKVEEITGKTPAKSHDLEYLSGVGGLSPDKKTETFLAELSNLSVITRYPKDFERMLNDFSKERVKPILTKTKEVFQWIEKSIK